MDWIEQIWHNMNSSGVSGVGIWDICLRLGCAMLIGLVVGTEREYTHRPAGMRTHILVALGACAVAITSEMLFNEYHMKYGATPDPARLSAQVITGVGFLGAGTIMREGYTVKGLTTAASVWAVACLGLAAGSGYYALALTGMIFIFVTLTLFESFQHKFMRKNLTRQSYTLETEDVSKALKAIFRCADESYAIVQDLEVEQQENLFIISFKAEYNGSRRHKYNQRFVEMLSEDESILRLRQTVSI